MEPMKMGMPSRNTIGMHYLLKDGKLIELWRQVPDPFFAIQTMSSLKPM